MIKLFLALLFIMFVSNMLLTAYNTQKIDTLSTEVKRIEYIDSVKTELSYIRRIREYGIIGNDYRKDSLIQSALHEIHKTDDVSITSFSEISKRDSIVRIITSLPKRERGKIIKAIYETLNN